MLTFKDVSKKEQLLLSVLLLISIISRFPFVLKGFGETDSANLAVSIIDFVNHGEKGFLTNLYFIDVVPLYVVYIKFVMKLLGNNYGYLTTVMNYTNAVVGTLIIIPAYLLVRRLFNNASIAFCSVLTFIFVPSIYQSSIYGFPSLIALFLFITSIHFFLIWLDDTGYSWLILSFIALTSAILFKSDIILGGGAYLGLLGIRKIKDGKKILSSFLVVILSVLTFLLLRHWMTGTVKGYTTSPSNLLDWFHYFFNLLISNKGAFQILKDQVRPIVFGMGILNFITAALVLVFYLVKRNTDVIVLIFLWTAVPTILWLLIHGNSARHNMLSVLPFIMIIFLFLYEKAPKLMTIFPIVLILGNYLLTSPSGSTRIPSGSLLKSRHILENSTENLHLIAEKIAELKDNKIILTAQSFRPYLYYEIFTIVPQYEMVELENSCYEIKNKGCIICTKLNDISYLVDMIKKYDLFHYTVVAPETRELSFKDLKAIDVNIYEYKDFDQPHEVH